MSHSTDQGHVPPTNHPVRTGSGARGKLILLVVILLAIALAAWGIVQRGTHYHALRGATEEAAIPPVTLITPQPGPKTRQVDLPANLAAWYEAPIYAQVSGYVKMWYKDYGAHVKRGDVLAEISTPSIDAQFEAAKAHYNVILARYNLAVITTQRWTALKGTQAVSRQEVDVQAANAAAQKAELEAARHDVDRFQALEDFKKIVAPFDGIVTSRLVNVGDYVNAGGGNVNSRGAASELFSVADVHRMRVFVSVPQDFASVISPKIEAELTVPQYPGSRFKATFLATANAFNAATRTVTTELTLDNDDNLLWPNSYATAHISAPGNPNILILPEGSIIYRAEGTQVAKVINNHAHLVNVTVGINFGTTVQVLSGITKDDRVVANPTADLLEGDEVRIVPTTPGYNTPGKAVQDADQQPVRQHDANPEEAGSR
ncbi:efflux RND transporter periplasmic adaptor subunit [Gluconobacter sp. Dm-74]|uniref:efflux RND transporter periplasmic adaptor subunit n=1 Tax=Gluconobacter TaxID=441 RepID=UPI0018856B51|nr:efflux RND transporter periplasmic adaptor subunit [Gluconobacter sp. Dm-44]MBS1074363.1 efflux RND transporter periplasmic adaptor subunit [Gluconobacter sp. Dm-73]MBS1091575.1 efflux RND transporter periplasmic adaptor subunit [Gluconobacter sp. Dm-74]